MKLMILHGSFGHPAENWIPSTADALRSEFEVVVTPSMPTPAFQSFETWSAIAAAYVQAGTLDDSTIVVAHSSAAPFVVRYVVESNTSLSGFVSVSGFTGFRSGDDDFDAINAAIDIIDPEETFAVFNRLVGWRSSFYGDDDPYLPQPELERFSHFLAGDVSILPKAGHCNAAAGYVTFPQLVSLLRLHV